MIIIYSFSVTVKGLGMVGLHSSFKLRVRGKYSQAVNFGRKFQTLTKDE